MLSGLIQGITVLGSRLISKFILKGNQYLLKSNVMFVLSCILFLWLFAFLGVFFAVVYAFTTTTWTLLLKLLPFVAGLAISMWLIFVAFRKIATNRENREGLAERSKLAQRSKAAVSAELDPFFAHRDREYAGLKHKLAIHVEKRILTMPTQEALRLSASFDAGKQTQYIREQIAHSCGSLAATSAEDEAIVYRNVIIFLEEQTAAENAAIAMASEKASVVAMPPVNVMAAISDSEDSNYVFCPKCNTRQRSNRTRCLECGTYFSET